MNWRKLALIGAVLLFGAVGLFLVQPWHVVAPASFEELLHDSTDVAKAQEANRSLATEPPAYSREAVQAGFRLEVPLRQELAVPGGVQLQGVVGGGLEDDIIYVTVYYPGESRQTAIPVVNGRFSANLILLDGPGEYRVTLSIPTTKGANRYVSATDLTLHNVSERSRQGAYFAAEYYRNGIQFSLPETGKIEADTAFTLAGRLPPELADRFIWVRVQKDQETWDSYLSAQNDAFSGPLHLGGGEGIHWATILLQSRPESDHYDEVAVVPIYNTNPQVVRQPLALNPPALKAKLALDPFPVEVADGLLPVSGTIDPAYNGKHVAVKVEQGTKSDDRQELRVENGRFTGNLALPFGAGEYSVQLLLPRSGIWYNEAATLQVNNQSSTPTRAIHYAVLAHEKRITLTSPAPGPISAEDRLTVQGRFEADPGPFPFVMAETKLGDLEARYRLPVVNGTFAGDIWLRFGPGEYEVTLYVTKDGTYHEGIAQFKADNTGAADRRETAPSDSVESDHPEIIAKAHELTQGKAPAEGARAVFDWVAQNVRYDVEKLNRRRVDPDEGALLTLRQQTGVCRDYANLAVALLRAAGMEAHVVTGTVVSGFFPQDHAWLEVRVGDRWLEMDPTFASGHVENGKFVPAFDPAWYDPDGKLPGHTRKGVQY